MSLKKILGFIVLSLMVLSIIIPAESYAISAGSGTVTVYCIDNDEDGYAPTTASSVQVLVGHVPANCVVANTDCDDEDASIGPDKSEICGNGVDDDCDGYTDVSDSDCPLTSMSAATVTRTLTGKLRDASDTVHTIGTDADVGTDADGDGYPTPVDCDDSDALIYPSAAERCDGIDNNCDDLVDDDDSSVIGTSTFYLDSDGDGYGNAASTVDACSQPAGYVSNNTDCDDTKNYAHPGASEICDAIDNDCDGSIDDADSSITGQSAWYADNDADNYGDPATMVDACYQPAGYVSNANDCDDSNQSNKPGALELCDGVDNDCDGLVDDDDDPVSGTTYYRDADGDGYGDPGATDKACSVPDGYVENSDDCDDTAAANKPGGTEVCDGADNDCDGIVDEDDATDVSTWYPDADGDGYGDGHSGAHTVACNAPAGYMSDSSDCNDVISEINPGATEVCDDGEDNNCDGLVDTADTTACPETCGDGIVDAGEACDDGNTEDGDVCSSDCQEVDIECADSSTPFLVNCSISADATQVNCVSAVDPTDTSKTLNFNADGTNISAFRSIAPPSAFVLYILGDDDAIVFVGANTREFGEMIGADITDPVVSLYLTHAEFLTLIQREGGAEVGSAEAEDEAESVFQRVVSSYSSGQEYSVYTCASETYSALSLETSVSGYTEEFLAAVEAGADDDDDEYDPCDGLACGDECYLCEDGDADCVESDVTLWCDASGDCQETEPSCESVASVTCSSDDMAYSETAGQCICKEAGYMAVTGTDGTQSCVSQTEYLTGVAEKIEEESKDEDKKADEDQDQEEGDDEGEGDEDGDDDDDDDDLEPETDEIAADEESGGCSLSVGSALPSFGFLWMMFGFVMVFVLRFRKK